MKIIIRQENPKDYLATEEVVREAFLHEIMSDHQEHRLIRRLRSSAAFLPELSLVALDEHQQILGHILLQKIKL